MTSFSLPAFSSIAFHRAQLNRLIELAASREDLYTISESERLDHASRKADAADGKTDTQPGHIYSLGRI
jgi:hypothetical protein